MLDGIAHGGRVMVVPATANSPPNPYTPGLLLGLPSFARYAGL